ncbi:hypothetical protein QE152_g8162 [Popillia japonica]|uniref:Uncharacterized protein n=1 Tax=Popillia japonica TaxID=7064 RepID=A0AAW1M5A0_POPJA
MVTVKIYYSEDMSVNRGRGRGRGRGVYLKQVRLHESLATIPTMQTSFDIVKANPQSNRISINLELEDPSEQWFAQFKSTWNLLKKCPAVTNMLHQHLDMVENAYEEALRLMYNCLDFKSSNKHVTSTFGHG